MIDEKLFFDSLSSLELNFQPNDINHLKLLIFLFHCECTEIKNEAALMRLLQLVEKMDDSVIGQPPMCNNDKCRRDSNGGVIDFIPFCSRLVFHA